MDRLSIQLTLMTGAVLTGSFVIVLFSLGYYAWTPLLAAVALGYALSWPSAYLISRYIKREDPGWDETRKDRTDAVPRINEPEV
jgi:predicted PurR-regulated permease PerM